MDLSLIATLPADLLEEKYTADVERVVSLVAAHSPQIVVIPGWVVPSMIVGEVSLSE